MKIEPGLKLPRVTVVIINRNYGRYLPQAIQSVMQQDYLAIDCIIADNGSDDGSQQIAASMIDGDPRFRLIELGENFGQLGALFKIFDEITGDFVVFLDADDMLTSTFVSTHVQVHLALPKAVPFTSSNITEIDADGHVLTGGYQAFGSPITWNSPGLVPPDRATRLPTIADEQYARISVHTSAISSSQVGWFWGPGSANMYRRRAIALICQGRDAGIYLRASDTYLILFSHALSGSALIDLPLSLYRIHGRNYYAIRETLQGIAFGRPQFEAITEQFAYETIDFYFSASARFRPAVGWWRFWEFPDQLSGALLGRSFSRSGALSAIIVRHLGAIRDALGDDELLTHLPYRLSADDAETIRDAALARQFPPGLAQELYARIKQQGPRPAQLQAIAEHFTQHAVPPPPGRSLTPRDYGPIAVISSDPPIIMTGIAYDEWLGIAGAFGRRFGNSPAAFIVYPTWSLEYGERPAAIAKAAREHRKHYPDHRLVFMGSTQQEADMLAGEGLVSLFLNKNFIVSDRVFRPLPDVQPTFDAIHNARFVPEKRYELVRSIESCAYLGYLDEMKDQQQTQARMMHEILRACPGHVLLNPLIDGRPRRLTPIETNRALNRARVGLCLSETEGSNNASMEYMLAGLGVVSTPSTGGRDVYFDDEFCIVCEPDPAAVRQAVAELIARRIPRDHIRQRTLARVENQRGRFLRLVNDLRRQLGAPPQPVADWPFGEVSPMVRWAWFDAHLRELERTSMIGEVSASAMTDQTLLTAEAG